MAISDTDMFRQRISKGISRGRRPKRAQAHVLWGKDASNADRIFKAELAANKKLGTAKLQQQSKKFYTDDIRDKVVKRLFLALPDKERQRWTDQAAKIDDENLKDRDFRKEWLKGVLRKTGHTWSDLLDVWTEQTSWPAVLITGGPGLTDDDKPRIISVHSNVNGDPSLKWHKVDPESWNGLVVPLYSRFLQQCFAPEPANTTDTEADCGSQSVSSGSSDAGANCVSASLPPAEPPVENRPTIA